MRNLFSTIVPTRSLSIATTLTPAQIRERLEQDVVARKKGFRWMQDGRFNGSVTERSFELRRTIYYKNSFLPRVLGRIEPAAFGARVHVEMELHPFARVFMPLWLGITLLLGVVFAFAMPFPWGLMPFAMLAFGMVLPRLGFDGEANKAEAFLVDALPAAQGEGSYR